MRHLKRLGASYDKVRRWEEDGWLPVATVGPDQARYYYTSDVDILAGRLKRESPAKTLEGEREARHLELFREGLCDVDVAIELREKLDDVRAVRSRFLNTDLVVLPHHVARLRELALRIAVIIDSADGLVELLELLVRHAEHCEIQYPARHSSLNIGVTT